MDPVSYVRGELSQAIFARISGPEADAARERIHLTPGERRFGFDDPIGRVHSDASMIIGGLRALLLQSLHPLAMAGVAQHSRFREDPMGRLHATSRWVATTTFATLEDVDREVRIVKAMHKKVKGTTSDGRPYDATDPDLLRWVHVAEIDSFLRAHDRYGTNPLKGADRDVYVDQAGVAARLLGASDVPSTEAELAEALAAFRPDLESTPEARETARWLVTASHLSLTERAPYTILTAAAVGLLPRWTRWPLRLPWLPVIEATGVRLSATTLTRTMHWAMLANRPETP
jgi:uncharacterized protein (DUF2236 family)